MYNLHTIRNLEILLASPLNICGFTTSTFDLVLGQGAAAASPASIPSITPNSI